MEGEWEIRDIFHVFLTCFVTNAREDILASISLVSKSVSNFYVASLVR